jgi:hypothetical protein
MNIAGTTAAIISLWKIIIPASDLEELLLLFLENIANPLLWNLLVKLGLPRVTHRIRKYVLNGDAKEAWRLKESYKDTFALEAVSVTSSVRINNPFIINVHVNHMLIRISVERPLYLPNSHYHARPL